MIGSLLVLGLAAAGAFRVCALEQRPLRGEHVHQLEDSTGRSSGGLHGRFLHITDFHPDTYYKPFSNIDRACHRGKGPAGYYGAEGTDCDSPMTLVNETFRWIGDNLKDKIDFVVWTGDSIRHDYDEKIPRTEEEVAELNRLLVDKLARALSNEGGANDPNPMANLKIPIVPTIGNNDIMPHNILKKGPNRWTKLFLEIWDRLIPEEQRHTFVEGGWFYSEVIPGRLAVVSLNTMYFYDSNKAVNGCDDKSEPGYEHMEWLRVQLKLLRERGMKAIIIGHVPPARSGSKRNWDETCWQKYALWMHQYRDVVVGSLYGHMNIDHFMLQDSSDIEIVDLENDPGSSYIEEPSDGQFTVQSKSSYLAKLRKQWSKMPSPPSDPSSDMDVEEDVSQEDYVAADASQDALRKKKKGKNNKKRFLKRIGGPWAERYSLSLVSPSVIPNFYPTIRVIEYNITGLENTVTWSEAIPGGDSGLNSSLDEDDNIDEELSSADFDMSKKKKKKKKKGHKKKKKPDFKVPEPPSSTTPPGPAYSNQPLTWLSYTQYFANLTKLNEGITAWQGSSEKRPSNWREYKLAQAHAVNNVHVPFEFEVEYDTARDEIYRLKDLTVRSMFELATRIAKEIPDKEDRLICDTNNTQPDVYGDESRLDETKKRKRRKKKKKKKKKGKYLNKAWVTFVDRAFVGYLDDDQIDDTLDRSY
ncbi:hypothetical protein VTN00DRAFT_9744 [Thermoascus crustaceus]|uniref:uncharacterized protein n=1 Tax=Thermoascus crustaceus TaxID=5088 RepID=UPI0037445DF5